MMTKNLAQLSLTSKAPEPAVKQDRSQSQRAKLSSSTVKSQCDLTEEGLSAVREELGHTATSPATASSSTNTSSTAPPPPPHHGGTQRGANRSPARRSAARESAVRREQSRGLAQGEEEPGCRAAGDAPDSRAV